MAENRRGISPWSVERQAGIESATVDSNIMVPQVMQPTLDSGFIDEKGDWKGRKSSDQVFAYFSKDEAIPNAGEVQAPARIGSLSMVGFSDIQIAIRVTNGGNFALTAVMASDGSADLPYYNLQPCDAAATLRGNNLGATPTQMDNLFIDASEALTADVWEIFMIQGVLKNQARLGFKIVNNSGGESDIETAFLRIV